MSFRVKHGEFAANTSTGNQSISGVGFQPTAVKFYSTLLTTATALKENALFAIGAATSTTQQWAVAVGSNDNADPTSTGRGHTTDSCIFLINNGAPVIDSEATLVSFDSDGFTINWTDAPNNTYLIGYIAYGGTMSVKAGSFQLATTTGVTAVTGVGFQPKGLQLASIATATAPPNATDHSSLSLGFAASTTKRGFINFLDGDSSATANVSTVQRKDHMLGAMSNATPPNPYHWLIDLQSFDSDGFSYNMTDAGNADYVFYLAFGGDVNVSVNFHDQPTVVSAKPTFVGLAPSLIEYISWGRPAGIDSLGADIVFMYGAGDARFYNAHAWNRITDGSAVATNARGWDNTNLYRSLGVPNSLSVQTVANYYYGSINAGFSLNWTTVDGSARELIVMSFGHPGGSTIKPLRKS
jgi:hypothetical protein